MPSYPCSKCDEYLAIGLTMSWQFSRFGRCLNKECETYNVRVRLNE